MVALLVSEIILVLACYTLALFALGVDPEFYLFDEDKYWKLPFMTGLIILGFYLQDLYAELRILSRILLVQQVCLAVGCALLGRPSLLGYIRAGNAMGPLADDHRQLRASSSLFPRGAFSSGGTLSPA